MSPGIILIIWLDRGPGFHRIPSPAIAANELHNQRCNRILFEAGATVLIESVTCQRTTPRQISICRAVAVRVNVRATNANFPAIRNRQLPLINVLYITKSKSNKLVTRLLVYTKPTYNPSLYIPLMNPPFPFIYYPRFDFRSKITSLNSLRLNLLESFLPLVVARLPDRLLAIRDTTNHHPCLIGGEPRERDLLHGSNTRRNSTPPEDGGFGLALRPVSVSSTWERGRRVEIGGDTPIIREMQLRKTRRRADYGHAGDTWQGHWARPTQDSAVRQDPLLSLASSLITDAAVPSSAVRIFDIAQLPA